MKRSKRMLTAILSIVFTLSTLQSNIMTSKVHAATGIIIDPSTQYQTMDGWGTSLAWWAGQVGGWSDTNRKAIEDLVFGDQGLGLNIVRYNIGGGDAPNHTHIDPARQPEGFETALDQWNWGADLNQRRILKEATQNYSNVNIAEAQSNSPPYWMTVSGYASGNTDPSKDNLKSDQYDNFANYLTEVVKHFKEVDGINFQYIDPVNEPNTNYWKAGGGQEGCHFDPSSQQTILNKVADSLKSKGIDTKITGTDETSIDTQINTYNSFDAATKNLIDRINVHTYSGTQRPQLRDLAQAENKKLYMSEYCTGYIKDDHNSMAPAVPLGNQIMRDVKDMGVNAWVIWQAVEDEKENDINLYDGTERNPPGSWGLIHGVYSDFDFNGKHFTKEQYFISKQYYVMAQFSKFIKQGYKIINANNDNVLAAMDPATGKVVIVTTNFTNSDTTNSFDLSRFNTVGSVAVPYRTSDTENAQQLPSITVTNNSFSTVLPANSITTFVVDGLSYNGATGKWINDNVIGTNNNTFSYNSTASGHWAYYNAQNGAYSSDVHYSSTKDDYYQVNFTGDKVKVYGTFNSDSGIAGISVDGGNETLIDCYSNRRTDNALIYNSSLLSNGSHTLKVRVTGDKNPNASSCYIVSDGVCVVTGDDSTIPNQNVPSIKSLIPGPERLSLSFTPVDGASSYNVKYRTESGDINNTINTTNTSLIISNLRGNAVYYVSVCAVINGQEALYSSEMRERTQTANLSNVVYYVDSGTGNPLVVPPGEVLGTDNSKTDQPYGRDAATGYNWGYQTFGDPWSSGDNDPNKSVLVDNGRTAGQGITYTFDIDNGDYNVSMGFYDNWPNSNRHQDIIINDVTKLAGYVMPLDKSFDKKTFEAVNVTNGKLVIKINRSIDVTDPYANPMISWIKIYKKPIQINNASVTVARNAKYTLPATVKATLSDNTIGDVLVKWDKQTIDTSLAGPQTINGTVDGYNGTVQLSINVTNLAYYVDCANTTKASSTVIYGGLNSIADKTLGLDTITGYSWGYDPNNAVLGWVNDSDPYMSLIYGNAGNAGHGINYTFQIPNGTYGVSFGFHDPWYDSHRYMDLVINGNTVKPAYILPDGNNHQIDIDNISVTNGQMTVSVLRAATATCDPIISWIKVVNIPQITQIDDINAVMIQNDTYTLPTTVTAKIDDGTTKQCPVSWDRKADTTKAGIQVFNGTVQGYSRNVKLTLTVNSMAISIDNLSATILKPGDTVTISGTNSLGETSIKVITPNSTILFFNVVKGTTFSDSFDLPTDACFS